MTAFEGGPVTDQELCVREVISCTWLGHHIKRNLRFRGTVDAGRARPVAVACEYASISEKPSHHQNSANEEGRTTAPAINVEEGRNCHDDIDDVLDRGGKEEIISSQAGHCKYVSDVVHHHVHTC